MVNLSMEKNDKTDTHYTHGGEWVAVCENKIVACGDKPSIVIDKAREICGEKETTLFRVPENNQILLL